MSVSLNPEKFLEGGGLIDDVDVVIKKARFEMFDYQGKADVPVPSLYLEIEDEDGNELKQYYSVGNAKDWLPSKDGKMLEAVGSASGIRMSTNGAIFLTALVQAGFPADKLDDGDISALDGMQVHVVQQPLPERKGIKKNAEQKAREEKYGPPTLLVVSAIVSMPGEKKRPKGAPKKAKGKKQEAKGNGALVEKAQGIVTEYLATHGSAEKKDLPPFILKNHKDDDDWKDLVKLVFQDEFLASGPWTCSDGTLTL